MGSSLVCRSFPESLSNSQLRIGADLPYTPRAYELQGFVVHSEPGQDDACEIARVGSKKARTGRLIAESKT